MCIHDIFLTSVWYPQAITAEADFLCSASRQSHCCCSVKTQTVIVGNSAVDCPPTDTCHHSGWPEWPLKHSVCTHTHKMQNHIQVQVTFYHAAASRNSDEDRFSHVPSFCVSFLQHQPLKSVLDKCSWHQGLISPSLLLCPRHRPVNPFNVRWI